MASGTFVLCHTGGEVVKVSITGVLEIADDQATYSGEDGSVNGLLYGFDEIMLKELDEVVVTDA